MYFTYMINNTVINIRREFCSYKFFSVSSFYSAKVFPPPWSTSRVLSRARRWWGPSRRRSSARGWSRRASSSGSAWSSCQSPPDRAHFHPSSFHVLILKFFSDKKDKWENEKPVPAHHSWKSRPWSGLSAPTRPTCKTRTWTLLNKLLNKLK